MNTTFPWHYDGKRRYVKVTAHARGGKLLCRCVALNLCAPPPQCRVSEPKNRFFASSFFGSTAEPSPKSRASTDSNAGGSGSITTTMPRMRDVQAFQPGLQLSSEQANPFAHCYCEFSSCAPLPFDPGRAEVDHLPPAALQESACRACERFRTRTPGIHSQSKDFQEVVDMVFTSRWTWS